MGMRSVRGNHDEAALAAYRAWQQGSPAEVQPCAEGRVQTWSWLTCCWGQRVIESLSRHVHAGLHTCLPEFMACACISLGSGRPRTQSKVSSSRGLRVECSLQWQSCHSHDDIGLLWRTSSMAGSLRSRERALRDVQSFGLWPSPEPSTPQTWRRRSSTAGSWRLALEDHCVPRAELHLTCDNI